MQLFELDPETVEYIKSKLPDHIDNLMTRLEESLELARLDMFKLLYEKYSKELTVENKMRLNSVVNSLLENHEYGSEIYDEMLNILNPEV